MYQPPQGAAPAQMPQQPQVGPANASLGYRPYVGGLANARPGLTPTSGGNPAQGATQPTTPGAGAPPANPGTTTATLPTSSAGNPSYASTSQFGPQSNLIGTQIAPGAGDNRFDLANQQLQTYANSVLPQFRADLRDTIGNNAALGREGSGMLNTSVGNLDLAQQNQFNTMKSSLLNGALNNQINDQMEQRNELRGERDYQNGLQTQAYNQGVQGLTLQDALTNSAFGRGLATEQAGYGSNPADMQAWLSGVYGNEAAQAGNAVGGLVNSTAQNNILQSIYGNLGNSGGVNYGGPGGTAPTGGPWSDPNSPVYGGTL